MELDAAEFDLHKARGERRVVGRSERVCGNTASMLADTRFSPFFELVGDRSIHFGEYPCGPMMAAAERASSTSSGESCC